MAAISSITGSGLVGTRVLWGTANTWQGGVIPDIIDGVTIAAFRTTINQSAISKWTDTRTITVASTSGFPANGYFHTNTNWGEVLNVSYTGITATTFTGCSLNESEEQYQWLITTNSNIPNGSFVHSPAPIVTIPSGYQANCLTLLIQNGGTLVLEPGAYLRANSTITLRDGKFIGLGNTGNNIINSQPGPVTTVEIQRTENNIGFFVQENFSMNLLQINGGENRSYGTINTAMNLNSTSCNVNMLFGSIEVGDEIAIYDDSKIGNIRRQFTGNPNFSANTGNTTYRDIATNYQNMDEGFDVVGKNNNQLWLARKNGARAKIKNTSTVGPQKVLTVDKNDFFFCQSIFKAGDIVVINNKQYTIDKVEDTDHLLSSYNFQTGSTLSDFLLDDVVANGETASSAWGIDSFGARSLNGNFNVLVNKNIWRREIIMDVEISPLNQYTTGSQGTDYYGLIFGYDPAWRKGHRGNYETTKTGFWRFADIYDTMLIAEKGTAASDWFKPSLDNNNTGTIRTQLRGPNTWRYECRNHIAKCFLNGEQIYERFNINGSIRGLFGVSVWNNQNVRVKSITYRAPCQNLFITTTDSFSNENIVYESGSEIYHGAGRKIVKLVSKITSVANHDDLAFSYRGAYDPGVWPLIRGHNANESINTSSGWLLNHNPSIDYFVDLGTGSNRYSVIDLTKQQTFTHVSYIPRVDDSGTNPQILGVTIFGSNDGTNWTTIYSTANDTKRYGTDGVWYNQVGYYYTGPQTYRYVRFQTSGHSNSATSQHNRPINYGVHNFSSNNFSITVNNVSDFAVGDEITVMTHNGWYSHDDLHHFRAIKANLLPEEYLHNPYNMAKITAINGNTLSLDAPISWGYIEGGESVVKINRNFKITGFWEKSTAKFQKPYFKVNTGTSTARRTWLRNVYFWNIGSSRITSSQFNRGIDIGQQDYNNPAIIDGCSFKCFNNTDANGLTFANGIAIVRNNFIGEMRDYRPYFLASYCGVATMNNYFFNCFLVRNEGQKSSVFSYNEAASAWQAHTFYSYGTDNFTSAHPFLIRRNTFHGFRDINNISDNDLSHDTTCPIYLVEYNTWYACNNTPFGMRSNQQRLGKIIGSNIPGGHPGLFVNRYRSDGFIYWYNWNNPSIPMMFNDDLQRAGYNIAQVAAAYHLVKMNPGDDYIRLYATAADANMAIACLHIYRDIDNIPLQMQIDFEYRHPMKYNRLQDGNWDNGRFRINVVHNGALIPGIPVYTTTPWSINSDAWQRYTATFTTNVSIPLTKGYTTLMIGRGSNTSLVDIRNMRAKVLTNDFNNVYVVSNTFDINKYYETSVPQKRSIERITQTSTKKLKRIKL